MSVHRCREQEYFWGCEGFLPEFPQAFPKQTPKNDPKKNQRLHFISCWAHFFKSRHFKHHFAQISPKLAQISPNLAEKN